MYDYEQTIELLQRAVAEKGDGHVVWGCRYVKNGEPSCIVGHVLSYVGLLDVAFEGPRVKFLPWPILNQFTNAAITALQAAQEVQDRCQTWGEALIAAKEIGL